MNLNADFTKRVAWQKICNFGKFSRRGTVFRDVRKVAPRSYHKDFYNPESKLEGLWAYILDYSKIKSGISLVSKRLRPSRKYVEG
jgi:hypothetical protein